jgi:two-component system LytT family response regulator
MTFNFMEDTRVIIVDDEDGARESLSDLLEKYVPNVKIVAKAESSASAYEKIGKYKPDLVFLDIEMPFGNGFDLLERMQPVDFNIIFVTAYDHYAIKAIKFSALDYLLKPVDLDELRSAVERHRQSPQPVSRESYQNLLENLEPENKTKKIALPDNSGITFVDIDDIIRCESDGNYTRFFLATGRKILVSKTLGEFENLLSDEGFFRVHRSHLINLSKITRFQKSDGGHVELSDGSKVEVSRRKRGAFVEMLQ